jgi:hypothetical protein
MNFRDVFIAHAKTAEPVNALKAGMQVLKIKFEISGEEAFRVDFYKKN